MNFDGLKVVFRTNDKFISARLQLECQRAFAVVFESRNRDSKGDADEEKMEMDPRFLQKINEYEYLYQQLVELPERSQPGAVMFNRENDTDIKRTSPVRALTVVGLKK